MIERMALLVACFAKFPTLYSAHPRQQWVVSSAVEHYLDMVGVTGSIPVPPTIFSRIFNILNEFSQVRYRAEINTVDQRLLALICNKQSSPIRNRPFLRP
jgi:hypothetical protein